MKQKEEKSNEWRILFEEKQQKNQTVREFCKEKGITLSRFYYYQDKVNNPDKYKSTKIDKATLIKPLQVINAVSKENGVIRFILPNSLQCVLPRDTRISEIKSILELMVSC